MYHTIFYIIPVLLLSSCSSLEEQEIPQSTIQQLTGIWQNNNQSGAFTFYEDETVKLTFPERHPPIKLISSYQIIKEQQIGIALGGFWSGPILIDTHELNAQKITVTFPDEEPITFTHSE